VSSDANEAQLSALSVWCELTPLRVLNNVTLIQHNQEHFTIWCKFSTAKNTYDVKLIHIGESTYGLTLIQHN
jgi:hypothetical protein